MCDRSNRASWSARPTRARSNSGLFSRWDGVDVIWDYVPMGSPATSGANRSLADLTRAYFGEALSMDEVFARVADVDIELESPQRSEQPQALWVGSVGYERYKDNAGFARLLHDAGVECLVDVRELPISRRRGYAKTALCQAMAAVGIDYVHVRALGNPKPFRSLYKSGRVAEGRARYEQHLLTECREALGQLVPLLRERPSALMCVEHDPTTCHRTVILDALREEFGIDLEVAEIS